MASHLHRYGSELARLENIIGSLSKNLAKSRLDTNNEYEQVECHLGRAQLGLEHVTSQLKTAVAFRQELESKTNNILALA
jgi:septation ring formation regulator EzrA